MALTVTRSGDYHSVMGNLRKTHATVAFDSSYPTGGESLTPADFGLRVIDMMMIEPKNGFYFEYDHTNQKVLVFKSQSAGVIHVDTSNVQNIATGEDELIVYNMPASVLSSTSMAIRATAWGTMANNNNTKILRGYFGSSSTGVAYLKTNQATSWRAVMEVVRTGAATQDTSLAVTGGSTATSGFVSAGETAVTASTITETLTSIMQIRFTGTATTAGDIIQSGLMVEALAPNLSGGGAGIEVPNTTDLSSLAGVRCIAWGV